MKTEKEQEIKREQNEIMSMLFEINPEVDNEYEAQLLLYNKMKEVKDEHHLDNFSVSVSVRDDSVKPWKQGKSDPNLFIKIFFNELQYAVDTYEITNAEKSFLLQLSPFLLWERNLIVASDGKVMNQNAIMKTLGMDRKTIYKHIKNLERKKMLIRIWASKSCYIVVNPYIMYNGRNINKQLATLFTLIDYIPLSKS